MSSLACVIFFWAESSRGAAGHHPASPVCVLQGGLAARACTQGDAGQGWQPKRAEEQPPRSSQELYTQAQHSVKPGNTSWEKMQNLTFERGS